MFATLMLRLSSCRLLGLLFCSHYALGWGQAAPLEITPEAVDFGRLTQNTNHRQTVMLRNTTTRPVRILQAQADCGCTIPKLTTPVLSPGQTEPLTVLFESRNYLGKITRRIQLVTDAGLQTLEVHATVTPYADWAIEPAVLVMPPSLVEQTAQSELTVSYTGTAQDAMLTGVSTDQPWLQAKLLPESRPGSWRMQLTKLPKAPPGSHAAVAKFATTDAHAPELKVNLVVPVASVLRVAPNPVILPRVKTGEETSASFRLVGWKHADQPQVLADGAAVAYLGSSNDELTFEVKLRADKTGSLIIPLKILRGDQLQMELKALATIDP